MVRSWSACQQIRCVCRAPGTLEGVHSGLVTTPPRPFCQSSCSPDLGVPSKEARIRPSASKPQHLSACPELPDGRAPRLLAPVQAAW